MKRFLKIGLGILSGIIVLVFIILVGMVLLIDPNDHKDEIANYFQKMTGRTLTIVGNIHVTFYPWLGFDLGKVSLGNAPGFAEPTFATVEQAQMQIKLIPLLSKRIEVNTVSLTGLELTLTRKPDGNTNWADLVALVGKSESQEDSSTISDLKIAGLKMKQSRLVWDDQQVGSRHIWSDLTVTTSPVVLNKPVDLQLHSNLAMTGNTTLTGQFDLDTQVTINLEKQLYQLSSLQFSALLETNKLPEGQHTFSLNTNLDLDLKQQTLVLDALTIKGLETTLSGAIQAEQLLSQPHLSGQLKLAQFNHLPFFLAQAGITLPNEQLLQTAAIATQFEANPNQIELKNLALQLDEHQLQVPHLHLDVNKQMLQANALSLQAFGIDLTGQVHIQNIGSAPTIKGQLAVTSFNPRELIHRLEEAQLGLPTVSLPDDPLLPLQTAALATQFQFNQADGIQLTDLNLQIDDKQLKTQQIKLNLPQETLIATAVSLQAFDLDLNGQLNVKQLFSQPTVTGQLSLQPFNPRTLLQQAKLNLPPLTLPDEHILPLQSAAITTQFQFHPSRQLQLTDVHLQIDDNRLTTQQLQLDLTKEILESPAFSLHALGIDLNGRMQIKQLLTQPLTKAKITVTPFNPQTVLQRLGQAPLQLPKPVTLTQASLTTYLIATPQDVTLRNVQLTVDDNQFMSKKIRFHLAQDRLDLDNIMLNVLGVVTRGNLQATQVSTQPTLQGTLKLAAFNPRQLLQRLEQPIPTMADPTALNHLSLETELQGGLTQLNLPNLKINLDNSKLNGNLTINNFNPPVMAFHLDIDTLDIDRYLPPKVEETPPTPSSPPPEETEINLPLDLLRTLNLNGTLKVGHFKAAQLKMTDLELTVSAQEGQIQLMPKAALYQGNYRGHLTLDVRQEPPQLNIDDTLNHIQAAPLLLDLIGDDKIAGIAYLNTKLTSEITTLTGLQRNLNGTIQFLFTEGALKGFNIGRSLRQAKALIKREPLPADNTVQTDFTSLSGTFDTHHGILHTDNLEMKSPLLRVQGSGDLVVANQEILFELQTAVVNTSKGQGGKDLAELQGILIPLTITGTLNAPIVQPDMPSLKRALFNLAKSTAAAKLNQEKRKLIDKHKDKIDESLRDLLKDWDVEQLLK